MQKLLGSKKFAYVLMTVLVFLWGLEYIAAKTALETIRPFSLICIKCLIGFTFLLITKLIIDRRFPLKRKDIPVIIISALFGDVIYFVSEYSAMSFLPISVITITLAFLPSVSVLTEMIMYKNKPTWLIVAGVLVSIMGVGLVIGADFRELFSGRYLGYLLAFAAVISWNIYNFTTKGLSEKYSPLDLTMLQQICAILIALPFALANLPEIHTLDTGVIMGVAYLGIVSSFIGFLIYVNAIKVIGPTPCALYSNFLPLTSTFFGVVLLNEYISGLQLLGGVAVIVSGAVVIWQKGKESESSGREL
jgi:drug/metabolite transporter (DMT)-like permease